MEKQREEGQTERSLARVVLSTETIAEAHAPSVNSTSHLAVRTGAALHIHVRRLEKLGKKAETPLDLP